jgi:hypothetical protein
MAQKDQSIQGGFLLFPAMPFFWRMALVMSLMLVGIAIQTRYLLPGLVPVIVAILLTGMKSISNKPGLARLVHSEEWESVTTEECNKIKEHYRKSLKWAHNFFTPNSSIGCLVTLVITSAYLCGSYWLYFIKFNNIFGNILFLDGGAFLASFLLSGRPVAYKPSALLVKMGALENVLTPLQQDEHKDIAITPMLLIEKTGDKGKFPGDIRLMVKFKDAPKNFMGMQIQVSINSVGAVQYPYLYNVLLAEKGFDFGKRLTRGSCKGLVEGFGKNMTIQVEKPEEVDVLVLRQTTTKTSGYHTNKSAQCRIVGYGLALSRAFMADEKRDKEIQPPKVG